MAGKILIALLHLYKKIISPLLPASTCRFYPTCSSYAIEVITKHGALKGSWFAVKRISRCHPLHSGGYDPIP